jgi:hypothetical protein
MTYYQWSATSPGSEPTEYRIREATPTAVGSANADSLDATEATLIAGPFNMLDAPFASGYFVGDYEALATVGTSFLPFFAATNCADLSCRALTSVTPPANRAPTGANSTDVNLG